MMFTNCICFLMVFPLLAKGCDPSSLEKDFSEASKNPENFPRSEAPESPLDSRTSRDLPEEIAFTNFNRGGAATRTKYIFGGTKANYTEFPYIVSLQIVHETRSHHFCGGAIIAPQWIVTARHCIENNRNRIRVLPNYNNRVRPDSLRNLLLVENLIVHPPGKNGVDKDVGLIKLKEAIPLGESTGLSKVKISDAFEPKVHDELVVAGWGRTERGLPDYLMKTTVLLRPDENCESAFNVRRTMYLRGSMLCAGDIRKDSCNGDSGGPLVMKKDDPKEDVIIGIVSWGPSACSKYPGVYVNVTSIKDWLKDNMGDDYCSAQSCEQYRQDGTINSPQPDLEDSSPESSSS